MCAPEWEFRRTFFSGVQAGEDLTRAQEFFINQTVVQRL